MKNKRNIGDFLKDFQSKAKIAGIEIEFQEKEKAIIEFRLLKFGNILFSFLKEAVERFGFNRFLLVFDEEKRERLCWYSDIQKTVIINTSSDLEKPEFKAKLFLVIQLARDLNKN